MAELALKTSTLPRPRMTGIDPAQIRARRVRETVFIGFGLASTLIGLVALSLLLFDLAAAGLPRLSWDFFTSFPSRRASAAGILSAWVGSLLVILVTGLIGIPLGVAAGIYLEEYAPRNWMTNIIEINVSNLAAVPSIVYGLLALGLFVYGIGTGRSVLTAGLTLGILTGVIIGLSRALGETAPLITIGALTFIAFLPESPISSEFPYLSFRWLFDGFTVLPIQAFNWISRPGSDFHANAAAAGLVLVTLTLALNAVAIIIRYRLRRRLQW